MPQNLIPVGTWPVTIVETYLGKSSQKQTPFIAIVVEDEHGGRLTHWAYLSDAAVQYTVELLEGLGWDTLADDFQIAALDRTDRLVGKIAEVVVHDEEYDGKVRRKIKYLNAPGGAAGPDAMETTEAKALSAKLRQTIIAKRGGVAPSASRGPAKPATPPRSTAAPAAAPAARPSGDTTQGDVDAAFDRDIPF